MREHGRSPGAETVRLPDGVAVADAQSIASSARDRVEGDAGYGAGALRAFLDAGGAVTTVRTEPGLPDQ